MNIAIFGFGTIGSGVKTVLDTKNIHKIKILKIFDRPEKEKEIGKVYTNNYKEIMNNPEIDTIVETMGGNEFAYNIIKEALKKGKNVVTANKEVVSLHLNEFLELAKKKKVKFIFEASCGGGIPLINPLIENKKVNDINSIYGILNGTTNFILSRIEEGMNFEEALKLAQEKGFAELDPTADLEGLDMVRKISILSDIAYDTFIDIEKVNHYGIKGVTLSDIKYLKEKGYTIKFVAMSKKLDNKIYLSVEPVIVSSNSLIANTKNEFNCVMFNGVTNGDLAFYGKGAGKLPTASAIVSDLIKIIEDSFRLDLKLKNEYEILDNDPECTKYFLVGVNKISQKLVESRNGNYTITKEIDGETFKKIKKYVSFYCKILN